MSAAAYYTLGEPEGATSAADSSGNQQPALTVTGSGAAVVFGNATGPGTDGLTAAEFAAGQYLQGSGSLGIAAGAVECWFTPATSALSLLRPILNLNADRGISSATFLWMAGTSFGVWNPGVGSTTLATLPDGELHHAVLTDDGATTKIYLDGVLELDDPTIPSEITVLAVGGGGGAAVFAGSVSHVAAFDGGLDAADVGRHYEAGATGFAGESAGDRITRLAGYAGVPAAEVSADPGLSTIGHFDIAGMTPIAAMQKVAETENGVLFDGRDGTLTFKDRESRYTIASSFTLDVTAQEVEADLEPKDDDQFLVNDVTASANGVPAGRVVDSTSRDENGHYGAELDTVTDDPADALAGAQWKVYQGKDPAPRYSSVTVDITNSSTSQAAAVLAADIGTRFTLSNLPTQAPGTTADLFVEGYTETITATSHRITFNTSPADGYDVWTIEDPVFGAYDEFPLAY